MKIVICKHFPPSGFKCITFFPWIILRKSFVQRFTTTDATHEKIHGQQQIEMLFVLFFVWYSVEWLIRFVVYWNSKKAYKNISFEREAYKNESDVEYLQHRKMFAWVKYIFHE